MSLNFCCSIHMAGWQSESMDPTCHCISASHRRWWRNGVGGYFLGTLWHDVSNNMLNLCHEALKQLLRKNEEGVPNKVSVEWMSLGFFWGFMSFLVSLDFWVPVFYAFFTVTFISCIFESSGDFSLLDVVFLSISFRSVSPAVPPWVFLSFIYLYIYKYKYILQSKCWWSYFYTCCKG